MILADPSSGLHCVVSAARFKGDMFAAMANALVKGKTKVTKSARFLTTREERFALDKAALRDKTILLPNRNRPKRPRDRFRSIEIMVCD